MWAGRCWLCRVPGTRRRSLHCILRPLFLCRKGLSLGLHCGRTIPANRAKRFLEGDARGREGAWGHSELVLWALGADVA